MAGTQAVSRTAGSNAIGTIYLHLCSGEVLEVVDVDEIAMTDEYVIFTREDGETVVVERREIYYSCCQPGAAPPAY